MPAPSEANRTAGSARRSVLPRWENIPKIRTRFLLVRAFIKMETEQPSKRKPASPITSSSKQWTYPRVHSRRLP